MPIYEYECKACGHRHEALQKVSDPLLTDCPECGKPTLIKLISAAGFRLSGSGWYETDFKTDNKRNLTSRDSQKKNAPKEGAKSSKKTDKKDSSKKSTTGKKTTKSSSSKNS